MEPPLMKPESVSTSIADDSEMQILGWPTKKPNTLTFIEGTDLSFEKRAIQEKLEETLETSCRRRRRPSFLRRRPILLKLENMNLGHSDLCISDTFREALQQCHYQLSLSHNPLFWLPESLLELKQLKRLDASYCKLHDISTLSRGKLPHLVELDLSHNRIADFLDESVCENLPNLKILKLRNNRITSISPPLGCLTKLEQLDVGRNDLMYFPENLERLASLKVLYLDYNVLSIVPELPNQLQKIHVSWNPISEPPVGVCESGVRAIQRYWKHKRRKR